MLKWLIETYKAEVICFAADIGQDEELSGLKQKALKTGASKIYIDDLREEFARDFVFPMLRAGAVYESGYLLGTSIARPLIAKRQVEIARKEKADAIAHGATGKGNDQVRFELTAYALQPDIQVIAPWREERFREQFQGRKDMIAYCEKHRHSRGGHGEEAVLDGPESPAHQLRGRHPRGSVERAAGGHVQAVRRRRRRRRTSRSTSRSSSRPANAVAVNGKKLIAAGRDAGAEQARRASTASAGSTWSRTGSSA